MGQGAENDRMEEHDFGIALGLSNDATILAIGIPDVYSFHSRGFVRIYQFVNDDWVQMGQRLEGQAVGDHFGRSVSISADGETVAIGASNNGYVQVYRFGNGV